MVEFQIIDLDESRLDELLELYKHEWWSNTRTKEETIRMLQNTTLKIGIIDPTKDRLVGFTRILTDKMFKAVIFDVIITRSHRGVGLGRMLIEAVLNHPELQEVQHIELYCNEDMQEFYQQFGFRNLRGEVEFMRLDGVQKT